MRAHPTPAPARRPRRAGAAAVALVAALGLLASVGCTRQQRAEQDGKDAGEAVCDVRDADSPEEVQEALDDLNEQLDDLARKYSSFTAEDRADLQEQMDDLAEHLAQGNDVLVQQDLAVIRRSVDNIEGDTGSVDEGAREGFLQGIDDCLDG
jgi:DNA-binding transcriptional MerR regulator